ncbi:integral membrane protein [Coprinopsis cinerea AmutBmut pab1-1]|nr:integral membrane protein [Coprinopsis cinerea AmutBmut pab1-1]
MAASSSGDERLVSPDRRSDEESRSVTPLDGTSYPPTPANEQDAIHFTPKRAMASFENLVAMANYHEGLKEARKIVWRDRGQPVQDLETLQKCVEHAAKGGLRSASLAFSIRALVNLVLALIRIGRVPRDYRPTVIRHALFGEDTWRFAAMLGTFTSLYKFLINALPILIPAMNPSEKPPSIEIPIPSFSDPSEEKKAKLSLSARAQLLMVRKRVRRWHAALAGTIAGGLAIMWEKQSRRGVISQQMFVRGLQGSYNAFAAARNLKIPHGDVIVFCLACGQIVYAFLLRPETLPRSYSNWMSQASKVPMEGVRINREMVRDHTFNFADVDKLLKSRDVTPSNMTALKAFKERFLTLPSFPPDVSPYLTLPSLGPADPSDPSSWYFPYYGPCSAVHPAVSHCSSVPLDRFFAVFKWMLPIYGALHFVPAVLFKWEGFMRDPGKVLVRAGVGSMRSSAFLGVFIVIYQSLFCYKNKLHRALSILRNSPNGSIFKYLPQEFIDFFVSKPSFWFPGFFAGLALLVEAKRRRGELAMYVLPKGLESAWVMARGKGWVFRTGKWGDVILTSIGMGMVMSAYQNDPQHLSGFVRRILYQFIGPN